MATVVTPVLIPAYTLVWNFIRLWFTIGAGFLVFSAWVGRGLKAIDEVPDS